MDGIIFLKSHRVKILEAGSKRMKATKGREM